jgi:uncharacterized membrane protein SirB2
MRGDIIRVTLSHHTALDDILPLRAFIANLQSQLPRLSSELSEALPSLLAIFPSDDAHSIAAAQLKARFEQTIQDISDTLGSLNGAVQFMESQRAVMEAESIARITELAFLFIHLSFAAALFSMQVRELSQPPPVAYFIAFAVSLSATTYALRILARSAWAHQRSKQY